MSDYLDKCIQRTKVLVDHPWWHLPWTFTVNSGGNFGNSLFEHFCNFPNCKRHEKTAFILPENLGTDKDDIKL